MAKSYIPHYQPAEDKAQELCEGLTTQQEKFDAITKYLTKNFNYDGVRANHLRELLGPDIERCFDKQMGVCMDLSALACCMFRAIGMNANVAFGNCTSIYTMHTDKNGTREWRYGPSWHAWCEIYVDGKKVTWDQMIAKKNWSINGNGRLVWTAEYKTSHVRK